MRWTVLLLAAAIGCGGAEKKVDDGAGHGADPEKARALLAEAEDERDAGAYAEARSLLAEAYRFSDPKTRMRIDTAQERLDETQATAVAGEAKKLSTAGDCQKAMATVAAVVMETSDAPQLRGLLRSASEESLLACVGELMEKGEVAEARRVARSPAAAQALDTKAHETLQSEVHDVVIATLLTRATEPMAARNWAEAAKVLQEAVAAGEADVEQRDEVLAQVRVGIAEDIETRVRESFGKEEGAGEALAEVDALLAAGLWSPHRETQGEPSEDSVSERMLDREEREEREEITAPKEAPVPKKLARLRRELAFWVACAQVDCKAMQPQKKWLYGNAWLHPLMAPKADTENLTSHGRELWVIAEGDGKSLVAFKKPKEALTDLAARAHVGRGWVDSRALKSQDTSEWLPPGESIIGTRVWGPLREGASELELGSAMKVDGQNVAVERLSDRTLVTVPRAQLQRGVTEPGLEVLAMCKSQSLTRARIDEVIEPKHRSLGDPRVKLTCFDAQGEETTSYEEELGAVRTKRAWLPPRR